MIAAYDNAVLSIQARIPIATKKTGRVSLKDASFLLTDLAMAPHSY